MSATKLDFHIKLLSGNNVVLVECDGFETELFMPKISHGRVGLQNIIPNRRCCYLTKQADYNANAMMLGSKLSDVSSCQKLKKSSNRKPFQSLHNNLSTPTSKNASRPKAFSTPKESTIQKTNHCKNKNGNSSNKENVRSCLKRMNIQKENSSGCSLSEPNCLHEIPSPEIVRCAMLPTPQQVVKETLLGMPSSIRLKHLFRQTSFESKPHMTVERYKSNLAKLSRSPTNIEQSPSNDTSELKLPATPEQLKTGRTISSVKKKNQTNDLSFLGANKNYETPPKWRKCITPMRTYGRKPISNLHSSTSIIQKSLKPRKTTKVIPTYLINPTQGKKSIHKIELRKRKLIVDPKVTVSPVNIQKQTEKVNIKDKLPITKQEYERSKRCAFDLLTNANKQRTMAAKLNQQFQIIESAHEGKAIEVHKKNTMKKTPSEEQHEKRRQLVAAVEKNNDIQKSKMFLHHAIVALQEAQNAKKIT